VLTAKRLTASICTAFAIATAAITLPDATSGASARTCDGQSIPSHVQAANLIVHQAYRPRPQWDSPDPMFYKNRDARWDAHRRCLNPDRPKRRITEHRRDAEAQWRQERRTERKGHRRREWRRDHLPYRCGPGRAAIPCYVVACESGFDWGAYNSSGAAGWYQLMAEHGRRWPVGSWSDKKQHHKIALSLWGGPNDSDWVCA